VRVGFANQANERNDGEGDQTVSEKIPWNGMAVSCSGSLTASNVTPKAKRLSSPKPASAKHPRFISRVDNNKLYGVMATFFLICWCSWACC